MDMEKARKMRMMNIATPLGHVDTDRDIRTLPLSGASETKCRHYDWKDASKKNLIRQQQAR